MKMKKSHKWEEVPTLDIRCPHCGVWKTYKPIIAKEGDIVSCIYCDTDFELGRQK